MLVSVYYVLAQHTNKTEALLTHKYSKNLKNMIPFS